MLRAKSRLPGLVMAALCLAIAFATAPGRAIAQTKVTAFMQAVAEAAAKDEDIAAFYKANGYKGIWTGAFGRDADEGLLYNMATLGDGQFRRADETDIEELYRIISTYF